MTPLARQTREVNRCFDMQHLRLQASLTQRWRRRLTAGGGPAAWLEFKAIYAGEIDDNRRALARRIRRFRHAGHLR